MFSLNNKTALITGASSGLGEGAAKIFAEAGAKVILTGRREENLEKITNEIGSGAEYIVLDVNNDYSRKAMMEQIENDGRKIDILFNNAGVAQFTPIFEENEENTFEKNFETNVFGLWHMLKLVANHMKNNKTKGSIINTASIAGMDCISGKGCGYGASKAAVIQLSKGLVVDLGEYGIRINCISPGFFKTEMTAKTLNDRGEQIKKSTPLEFVAEPEELKGALLYLACNEVSKYTTGANLVVDGGLNSVGRSKTIS